MHVRQAAKEASMQLPVTPAADWITSRAALEQWLAALPADAALDLDTEFMRRNTFYPQLALLQLGWDKRYALVDPLAFEIGDALRPLIELDQLIASIAGDQLEDEAGGGSGAAFTTTTGAGTAGR